MIIQTMIVITGVIAIFMTQSKNVNVQKYACIFGLIGQPFWIWASLESEQWGMLTVSVLYTIAWFQGFYNYWIEEKNATPIHH
jgi:hypothetical protein